MAAVNAKLGKMGAKCIGYSVLLSNQEMARAVEHQAALLLRSLSLNEPHGRPPHRLANRLRIRGIVLLSFDLKLTLNLIPLVAKHTGDRDEIADMAKFHGSPMLH
jgi:hypothetical protein